MGIESKKRHRVSAFSSAVLFAFSLLPFSSQAKNGEAALNYYSLITLSDPAIGAKLAARFKAKGQPVFLVHDLNAGLGQGDIMRFVDKAVLVDPDVWNTLQAENALENLQAAAVIRVQGQTRAESWEQRSSLVSGERERKAFKLGAELIHVLEETFGGAPLGDQLTVEFHEGHLTLMAPAKLLDQLRFSPVRKVVQNGGPRIVSVLTDTLLFVGQPFSFQVWAVDPTTPEGTLTYRLRGDLPPGLDWDAGHHALRGTPTAGGRFHIVAEARDPKGARDTLGFTLRLHTNKPPLLAGTPTPVAVMGKPWSFHPEPVDPDHPSYLLRVRPVVLAPGMTFDRDSLLVHWKPDSTLVGTRDTFSLSVEDPLGGRQEFRYAVQVISADDIQWSDQIQVVLPWDTLSQGKTYTWKGGASATAWAAQGVVLQNVTGSDTTAFENGILTFTPMGIREHRLVFHFRVQGSPLTREILLPVKINQPPAFVTELTEWKMKSGEQRLRYRPVAIDPEGEKVALAAEIPPESPLQWDGKELDIEPDEAGVYPARVTATDPGGHVAEQWIAFRAEPADRKVRWIFENRVEGGITSWLATADFGTGRLGFYTPDIGRSLSLSNQAGREWPFIFFGGNLMGRANEAKGRRLWTDLGFTLRLPDPHIATGGVYGRINGEWAFPHALIAWVEGEFTGHVHQALVLADTSSFRYLMNDFAILNLSNKYSGVVQKIVQDATASNNAAFFSRLEAYSALGYGFYAGPCVWREDFPMDQRFYQLMGGAFRYRQTSGQLLSQVSLRAGWGPGGAGFDVYATVRVSLGEMF